MRLLFRILLSLIGTVLLVLVVGFYWLYFYSRDLPDVGRLAQYAPTTITQVSDPCLGNSTAIPYDGIGANVRNAITAAEASETDPSMLSELFRETLGGHRPRAGARIQTVVSRSLFCTPSKMLKRHFDEVRIAIQLARHYSRRQLFTIFVNRIYLGPDLIGIQQGSEFYFHKNPAELSIAEAALLVGLVRSPTVYSPSKHPDRALRRRNEVIDAMVDNGRISLEEAQVAKSAQLGIIDVASAGAAKRVSP